MTHPIGYYGETSIQIPTELAVWNLAAHQASIDTPLQSALFGINARHRTAVTNAYKIVKQAKASGLFVSEEDVETHCYNAGCQGQSLEVALKSIGYWLHDTGSAYWEQGKGDAYADQADASEGTAFDLIHAHVSTAVEKLGFSEVSIRCDQFDSTYTVAVWDKSKNRRVPIARAVMVDDILAIVNDWAVETTAHRAMNRQLRVLNGFEDFEQVAA